MHSLGLDLYYYMPRLNCLTTGPARWSVWAAPPRRGCAWVETEPDRQPEPEQKQEREPEREPDPELEPELEP